MQNSIITILPPLIVLVLAFLTHRILFSLSVGILTGTLIANDFAIIAAIKNAINTIWNTTQLENVTSISKLMESNNILLFIFLLILGSIIVLMSYTGGASAYRNFIEKKIKTKTGAQNSSLILSLFFFLDDYFSCATVGSVMHPLTDKFKIARTKLAFLVNSIAPTLAVIVPISSWSAAIVLNISNAGVSDIIKDSPLILADPFYLYLGVIPFVFYSIIMIPSAWFISLKKIQFGLMKKHENIAEKTGNLLAGKKDLSNKIKNVKNSKTIIDFLFPLLLLITSIILLILLTGKYY
ncbi:Na+/H+ antiporter NhaC family protein, partial [Candidatus Dependentiae bacterium]|nr:Na+/H+ antiporter NhaC family protein [Candidatus Dependentiae bacterium]